MDEVYVSEEAPLQEEALEVDGGSMGPNEEYDMDGEQSYLGVRLPYFVFIITCAALLALFSLPMWL